MTQSRAARAAYEYANKSGWGLTPEGGGAEWRLAINSFEAGCRFAVEEMDKKAILLQEKNDYFVYLSDLEALLEEEGK